MIRALEPRDTGAVLRLWNASSRFDPLSSDVFSEKVWEELDPCLAVVWEEEDELRGFACGVWRPTHQLGYLKMLCVAPAWRSQEIGTRLLQTVEAQLREWGASRLRLGESHPNYLQPGVDLRYTAALVFFEKHGYERVGETYNMRCDLARADFWRDPPAGLEVRRAWPSDQPATMAFLQEHFPSWQAEVSVMFTNDPISLHLAFQGEELVGFAGTDGNNRGSGWFGPMATHPRKRGLGVGGVLLGRCLTDFQNQGLTDCVIPWVGPYQWYSRQCNAYLERTFWRYEKSFP